MVGERCYPAIKTIEIHSVKPQDVERVLTLLTLAHRAHQSEFAR